MDRDEIEFVCTRALAKLGFRLMHDTLGKLHLETGTKLALEYAER